MILLLIVVLIHRPLARWIFAVVGWADRFTTCPYGWMDSWKVFYPNVVTALITASVVVFVLGLLKKSESVGTFDAYDVAADGKETAWVKLSHSAMEEEIKRINDLHLWDFEIAERDGDTLLILGSNDFVYYHYLEAEFYGVRFCDLPRTFSHAQFRLGRESTSEQSVVWVRAESSDTTSTEFEIQASGIEVRMGRVYYCDRKDLQPGERIASRFRQTSIARPRDTVHAEARRHRG